MAWNAEIKRRHWYCFNGWNDILWYDEFLYNQWWNSLTDDEQQKVKEYERKKREREKEEARQILMRMKLMVDALSNITYGNTAQESSPKFVKDC